MIPRYYQGEALDALYQFLIEHPDPSHNPVLALPTGTGKSGIPAWFIKWVIRTWPTQRAMVLTHVKELIEQNAKAMVKVWPQAPIGVYSAGLGEKTHYMPITFAGIQSARVAPELFGHIDLIFIDECHLVSPDEEASYLAFIAELRKVNPKLRVIGLSATPYRLGLGMITEGGLFTHICYDITSRQAFNRLIDDGYLSTLVPMATNTELPVDNVKKRGGEFIEKDLQKAVVKYDLTLAALREACGRAADRKHWLVYATGIDHVNMICEILDEFGISNAPVHSKLSAYIRDDNIARFKAGQIKVLVNANILTTGFDFPALDCILLLRPTNSPVMHVQILGRGTRPLYAPGFDLSDHSERMAAIEASGKSNCLVLDFAGNTMRLGPINDPKIPRKKGEGTGEIPVKVCDACGCLNHISARFCVNPECGEEFEFKQKITPKASTLELVVRDQPQVFDFRVDRITYDRHSRPGKIPSLKVSYYCGVRRFQEFVLLEHHSSPIITKAQSWWRHRTDAPIPFAISEAMTMVETLKQPRTIRVWVNAKPYPVVMAANFEEPKDVSLQ